MKIFFLILIAGFVINASGTETMVYKSPELAFKLPGQGDRLLSQYRGKVVALEFILTTCPHCQAASQIMNKMQERYGRQGFQAIDVAIDPNADLKVDNFAKDHHVNFQVGWTGLEQMMAYMGFSERPVVPQLILIDRAGNIHYATPRLGDSDSLKEDVIEKRLTELLSKKDRPRLSAARTK